jgi:hypothetical protein
VDGPHAGDLPDVYVNKDGTGRYEALMESISLAAGKTSVFDGDGSAIVIHALPDDNVSDPTGNSGDRIACGVIEKGPQGRGDATLVIFDARAAERALCNQVSRSTGVH